MEDRALGFAAAAHAQLAEPAARLRLRGRRSRRLPHDARDHRLHRALRRCDLRRRSGPTPSVTSVRRSGDGYEVATDQGDWQCDTVVLATGACNIPQVPAVAEAVPPAITTLTPMQYRNPDQLEAGRRARRRRLGHRHPDRRRDSPLGPARDARGGRARPGAARLSGQGHPVVDGRRRRARRALRRGRRHRPGPQRAVAAARGLRPSAGRSTSTRSPTSA